MTLAVFKLESFSAAAAAQGAQPTFGREALDQAYADGLAEGIARQQDEQARTLNAGLERLARALADDEARRAELRREAVEGLAPVLAQILDCLAPAAQSRRLEEALTAELLRLSRAAPSLRARVTCGPSLRDMVDRCLADCGLEGIEVTESDCDRIALSLAGGRIELEPARVADTIRALIAEISGPKPKRGRDIMDALSHLIDTDAIQVEVTVRLGRTRQTVAQLSALRPDDILLLDQSIDEGVEICVGDKVIARGELTSDGSAEDRLCVRILPAPGAA
ncbi:FliM/FliN family flagellar motor switch protein [Paracoccus benzoatiresistens]|uniref:FliM/FliN family flagellar motor switch protein n=1 Tax=Paracoccus benzoatiresistens TaxID=2997341 RepID=A0ABT4IZF9_9RHOB|nr:FliM/FliN family flagellar motor switch protein [Paracoccus sp. EF6]MCZ0960247.1 FliM/FliN family flagellar motor switch protein [Paracoccus sp. EF6]